MADQTSLQQREARRARRPRGKALRWSEIEIAVLSVVERVDGGEARALWRRHAPTGWEALLDATATIG